MRRFFILWYLIVFSGSLVSSELPPLGERVYIVEDEASKPNKIVHGKDSSKPGFKDPIMNQSPRVMEKEKVLEDLRRAERKKNQSSNYSLPPMSLSSKVFNPALPLELEDLPTGRQNQPWRLNALELIREDSRNIIKP